MSNNPYQNPYDNSPVSPYAAPTAEMSEYDDFEAYNTEPFYSKTGRIGRLRFMAYSIVLGVCAGVLLAVALLLGDLTAGFSKTLSVILMILVGIPGFIAIIYAQFAPAMRRFNDLGKSGWYALLLLIPYLSALVYLYLSLAAGDDGMNDYGAPAEPPSTRVKVVALAGPVILGILIAIGIFSAFLQ